MNVLDDRSYTSLNRKDQGFTLIEMMLVVAIIGILASVALPVYDNYIQKTQVASALQFVSASKSTATVDLMTNGQLNAQQPIFQPDQHLQCVTVDIRKTGRRGQCNRIHITAWPTKDFDPKIRLGRTRMFELYGALDSASGTVEWLCGPFRNANKNVDDTLLPSTCKDTIPKPSGRRCLTGAQRAEMVRCRRNR